MKPDTEAKRRLRYHERVLEAFPFANKIVDTINKESLGTKGDLPAVETFNDLVWVMTDTEKRALIRHLYATYPEARKLIKGFIKSQK